MGSKSADEKRKNSKNKHKSKRSKGSDDAGGNNIIEDPRFAKMHSDPRFQTIPESKIKVAIDSRFDRIYTVESFATSSAPLDKRGRRKKQGQNAMRQYYHLEEEEDKRKPKKKEVETESSSESQSEEEDDKKAKKKKEEIESSSESVSEDESERSDMESSSDEDDEEMEFDEDPVMETENVATTEESSRRLAVVSMDWRHVRAVDLYIVLRSFLPRGGEIMSVAVYPSEFGLQRMKEEEVRGPVSLFDDDNNDEDDKDDDGDEIDHEKLLAYEKSRLRYYFAVVECDSIATADHLYKNCDGVEFEKSSNVLDLRFIPDSMEFKHPPRDVATEAPKDYEQLDFLTKSLQHTNPGVSWDEDEPQRAKTLKRKFNGDQLADLELNEFLASDESGTDSEDAKRDKYRALLHAGGGSDEDDEEGQEMEVTFNAGLDDLSKHILEKRDKQAETAWEAYLRKRHEKKKARKNRSKYSSKEESSDEDEEEIEQPDDFFIEEPLADKGQNNNARGKGRKKEKHLQDTNREAEASRAELELLFNDDKGAQNGVKGYNLKPKKTKGKRGKEVLEVDKIPTIDYDPRFSAVFKSPKFARDPTDAMFKWSAVYLRQCAMRQEKDGREESVQAEPVEQLQQTRLLSDVPEKGRDNRIFSEVLPAKKEKLELSSLVRSVKKKAMEGQLPPNGKTPKKAEKMQNRDVKVMKNSDLSSLVQSVKKKAKLLKQ